MLPASQINESKGGAGVGSRLGEVKGEQGMGAGGGMGVGGRGS